MRYIRVVKSMAPGAQPGGAKPAGGRGTLTRTTGPASASEETRREAAAVGSGAGVAARSGQPAFSVLHGNAQA